MELTQEIPLGVHRSSEGDKINTNTCADNASFYTNCSLGFNDIIETLALKIIVGVKIIRVFKNLQ